MSFLFCPETISYFECNVKICYIGPLYPFDEIPFRSADPSTFNSETYFKELKNQFIFTKTVTTFAVLL